MNTTAYLATIHIMILIPTMLLGIILIPFSMELSNMVGQFMGMITFNSVVFSIYASCMLIDFISFLIEDMRTKI